MSNRWLGILPGVLMAAGLAGRNLGYFGGNQQALAAGLSQKDLDGNNALWARLGNGQRPQMPPDGPQMPMQQPAGPPMPLPGMTLAGAAPHRAMLPQMNIRPQQPATQQWAPPQPPTGLLSNPDETRRQAFLMSQGIGRPQQISMR